MEAQTQQGRPRREGLMLEALWLKHLPNAESSHQQENPEHDWTGDLGRFQPTFPSRVLGGRCFAFVHKDIYEPRPDGAKHSNSHEDDVSRVRDV